MVKEALVERDVDSGRRLIEALDQAGFPVIAALWRFLPDEEEWRLLIASPRVNELGPLAAYTTIQDMLFKQRIDLPLHRISVVSPEEPPVAELRIFAGTDPKPFIGGTYLQKEVVGEIYIEGAYVYRAERIIGKSGTIELWLAKPDKSRKIWIAWRAKATLEDGFFKKVASLLGRLVRRVLVHRVLQIRLSRPSYGGQSQEVSAGGPSKRSAGMRSGDWTGSLA